MAMAMARLALRLQPREYNVLARSFGTRSKRKISKQNQDWATIDRAMNSLSIEIRQFLKQQEEDLDRALKELEEKIKKAHTWGFWISGGLPILGGAWVEWRASQRSKEYR